jgi:O-antigen ligase
LTAHAATAPRRNPLWPLFGLMGLFLATLAAMALGNPLAGIGVPVMAGIAYALYRLPLKVSAISVMALAFFCEGLEIPLGGFWPAPFAGLARVMLINMSAFTGIGALRAPLVDLLTVGLCIAASYRDKRDGWTSQLPMVRPMNVALTVSAVTLVALDLLGTARGGDFNESLWQLRHTLLFPLRVLLLLRALDGTVDELKTIGKVVIGVTILKSLIGIYFLREVAEPLGRDPEFTTSHTDTLLFVPVLAIFINLMIERFTWKNMFSCLPWVAIVLYGMNCNDRRLAYVCLAFCGIASLLLAPWTRFKKILARTVIYGGPLFVLYAMAGWSSTGGRFFFLARLARSLLEGDPTQVNEADYRDLENMDVMYSWSTSPLVPNGYGHKMQLLFPLPDISNYFATWQYHPHNQYLWTMSNCGPLGFTLVMMPFVVALYLAARTYRVAQDVWVRVAMLTCIGTIISVFAQWYGDMGSLSWTVSWMGALASALACKWAIRTGAWPSAFRPPTASEPALRTLF